MVRKKSTPVRNLRNNTLQILTERVESLERERAREEEEMNTTICLAVPRRRDLGHRRGGGGRTHVCEVCDKELSSKQSLEKHKRIHTGEKPFKCKVCDKAFNQRGNLKTHSRTHMLVTPYMCGRCNEACTSARNLTVHLRTHTGEKPFKCEVCARAFTQQSTLTRHMSIHTGE
jgi:uncharacterized Zn-finger protein